jgi:hypothetical protein
VNDLLHLCCETVALNEDRLDLSSHNNTAFHNSPVTGQKYAFLVQGSGNYRGIVGAGEEKGIKTCHAQPLRHFSHIMVDDKFKLGVNHLSNDGMRTLRTMFNALVRSGAVKFCIYLHLLDIITKFSRVWN